MKPITIIIPTSGRQAILRKVLPSYLNQWGVCEILIVSDGGDSIPDNIMDFSTVQGPPIRVIRHPRNLGLPATRNTGILNATSEFVFFGEDDVILQDGHLEFLYSELNRVNGDIISGIVYRLLADETFEAAKKRVGQRPGPLVDINRCKIRIDSPPEETTEVAITHALILMKREFAGSILYNTSLGGPSYLREDQEFCLASKKLGAKIFVCPDAVACHLSREETHGTGARSAFPTSMILSAVNNALIIVNSHFNELKRAGYTGSPILLKARLTEEILRQFTHYHFEGESSLYRGLLGAYRKARLYWVSSFQPHVD